MSSTDIWSMYFLSPALTFAAAETELTARFELHPHARRFWGQLRPEGRRRVLDFSSSSLDVGLVLAAFSQNSDALNKYGDAYLRVGGADLGNISRMVEDRRLAIRGTNGSAPAKVVFWNDRWRGRDISAATVILFHSPSDEDTSYN